MTKPLAASQQALMEYGTIAPVILAKLTIYTDPVAGTVNKTYYWSYPHSVLYDLDGGGDQQFVGCIQAISVPGPTMPFPFEPEGFSSRAIVDLTLTNELDIVTNQWRWRELRQRRLANAELVLSELLVPPGRKLVDAASSWWDMRDLPGTEHTVLFRGKYEKAEAATESSFRLRFASEEPRVPKIECLDSSNVDPRDFGAELPIVYGAMSKVPLRNLKIGWNTTLAETITADQTGQVLVTDASGFPTGSTFDLIVGSEIIECSGSDDDIHTVTINARGHDDSAPAIHTAGDQILELTDEIVLGNAGHWIKDVKALYVRNPFNGELVRFTNSYLYRRGDQRGPLFGFPAGSEFSTTTIDGDDFKEWLLEARASARVTVQPEFDTGAGTPGTPTASPFSTSEEGGTSGVGYGEWTGTVANPVWTSTAGSDCTQLRGKFNQGVYNTDTILRFRVYLQATVSGWTGGPAKLRFKGMTLLGCFGDPILLTANGNGTYSGYTRWMHPTNKTLEDLDTLNEEVILQPSGAVDEVWTINTWRVEAETNPGGAVTREIDTEIEAAATGYGLEFFADIEGAFVPYLFPSTTYGFEEGGSGSWNVSNCIQIRDGTDPPEGSYFQTCGTIGATAVMQYLSPGGGTGVDLQAQDDVYRLRVRGDNVANIVSARLWMADSGSGTTVPANRIELEIPADVLIEDEWVDFQQVGVRFGTPDVSDCDCIGLEVVRSTGPASLSIDDLRVASATNANYDGAPFSLIEKMPDIIRHFAADYCGLGYGYIDDTTFDLALTNLGTNKHALIATGLGASFDEIIGRIAYEARCGIVRVEGASSTQLKLSTPNSSGVFPAVVREIDRFFSISESLPELKKLGTRFRSFWDWNPFLDTSEIAFSEVSRGDPDVDDTGIGTATFTTREDRYGRIDHPPFFFLTINDEPTAESVLGHFARYYWLKSSFVLEVPVYFCFDLDPGDTVDVFPKWEEHVGPGYQIKCLVLAVFRTPGDPTARLEVTEVS